VGLEDELRRALENAKFYRAQGFNNLAKLEEKRVEKARKRLEFAKVWASK
jgi:hypothetical protein